MAWILWSNHPRRYAGAHWVAAIALGVGLCFVLKTGTLQARRFIEPLAMSYLQDRIAARGDPYRAYTAIGQIGELKLSDRIVLRVEPGPRGEKPQLLHQATEAGILSAEERAVVEAAEVARAEAVAVDSFTLAEYLGQQPAEERAEEPSRS